jgi:hypothetical protein
MSNISLQYFKYCVILVSLTNLKTLKKIDGDYLFDTKITIVNTYKKNNVSYSKIFGIVKNFTYFRIEYTTPSDLSKSFISGIISPMFVKKKEKLEDDTLITYYNFNTPVIEKLFYYNKYITEALISTTRTTLKDIIYRFLEGKLEEL